VRRHHPALCTIAALCGILALACSEPASDAGDGARGEDGVEILRLHRASEHKSLDPVKQFDQASHELIHNLYDTLLSYHYLKRPYQLEPNLLERMPERQADGVTYLFTLKRGVRFIDDECFEGGVGRELTADDAIWNIKRFADANENVKSWVMLSGFVEGLDAFRERTKDLRDGVDYDAHEVSGLTKVGSHSFTVTFTRKNPLGLFPFAMATMAIVPREAVEHYGDDFSDHPVGTGPFRMARYSRRGRMVLVRNEHYHGVYPSEGAPGDREAGLLEDAGRQIPFFDEVHLPLIEEPQPAMLKFERGEIDVIGLNKDDFQRLAERTPEGGFVLRPEYAARYDFYVEPRLSAEYISFNMRDPVVGTNRALRQAVAYALDTPGYIDLMLNGRGLPLSSIVPHPIAGSERDIPTEYYGQDREKARQKLAEAGFPGGEGLPPLTIEIRSATKDARQGFEYLRNDLAQVGIVLEANFSTFSAYLKKVESGNFQMTSSGWMADYPDAENFYQLLYGPNETPGPNMSSFQDDEYDRLYEEIKYMEDGPERFARFRRMNEIIREEVPVVLRFNGLAFGLYQPEIRNLKRNMMLTAGSWRYMRRAEGD